MHDRGLKRSKNSLYDWGIVFQPDLYEVEKTVKNSSMYFFRLETIQHTA